MIANNRQQRSVIKEQNVQNYHLALTTASNLGYTQCVVHQSAGY